MNAAFELDTWLDQGGGEVRKQLRGAWISWWTFEPFVSVTLDSVDPRPAIDRRRWVQSTPRVSCLADAERIGEALIDALHASLAARKFPRGPNAINRLAGNIDRSISHPDALIELAALGGDEKAVARVREPGALRAPSHSGLRPETPEGTRKEGSRPAFFEVSETKGRDLPKAVELAREHLSTLHDSVDGHGGDNALFGAAVALVRGFGLLPHGYGKVLLAEYNRDASPPWPERTLDRVLERAERIGSLAWGVLFFSALAERRGGRGPGRGAQ